MDTSQDFKVTIGIVTYNRPEFLRAAVKSVLEQSFSNFELIISNDYVEVPVTFDSLGIQPDPRIKIVNQNPNLGEVRNMNFLLEIAKGEWFVWLCDDDLFHPEFLMTTYNAVLESNDQKVVGFFSNYAAASAPDGVFPASLRTNEFSLYAGTSFLYEYTLRKISLVGCYGLMHLGTLRAIGGIPSLGNSFGPYGDTLIPILLAEYGDIGWLDEPLIFLRTHADSLSCKSAEFAAFTTAEVDFLERLKRVCASEAIKTNPERLVANMIRWFSSNEFGVLSRSPFLGKFGVVREYLIYQCKINLPRLSFSHKLSYLIFIFIFLSKYGYGIFLRSFRKWFPS